MIGGDRHNQNLSAKKIIYLDNVAFFYHMVDVEGDYIACRVGVKFYDFFLSTILPNIFL